ncbi:MAG: hypothetical protein P8X63_02865, partial [Desulfuromonadaceae bacterium]
MAKDRRKFDIGGKRGRTMTREDPYLDDAGLKEPALCTGCRALYRNKRWNLDPTTVEALETNGEGSRVTCPACQKIAQGYAEGVVTLRGDYFWKHEEEICNILR